MSGTENRWHGIKLLREGITEAELLLLGACTGHTLCRLHDDRYENQDAHCMYRCTTCGWDLCLTCKHPKLPMRCAGRKVYD